MFKISESYLKLPGSYLFSAIAEKAATYKKANPDRQVIRLGIGDATLSITPAIMETIHKAADGMRHVETFHSYAPDLSHILLRETVMEESYKSWGYHVEADEIFVSDGAKNGYGNIQEIFSGGSRTAVCDPVYPVYVDSNIMAGRTGSYDPATGVWSNVVCMLCTTRNRFVPAFPEEMPDLIYPCVLNNLTGTTLTRGQLEVWINYANRVGAVILYGVAYEAYISEEGAPHNIFEIQGTRAYAIGFRSFSKKAGFTGARLGFTVVPKDLRYKDMTLHSLQARCRGTKFNRAPCIEQRAGEAVYPEEGSRQVMEQVAYYKRDAKVIYNGLKEAGYAVFGGINSPHI